jgi:hypothetical protein
MKEVDGTVKLTDVVPPVILRHARQRQILVLVTLTSGLGSGSMVRLNFTFPQRQLPCNGIVFSGLMNYHLT